MDKFGTRDSEPVRRWGWATSVPVSVLTFLAVTVSSALGVSWQVVAVAVVTALAQLGALVVKDERVRERVWPPAAIDEIASAEVPLQFYRDPS